jgi:ABC-type lipoprotein export system ATPase subunit
MRSGEAVAIQGPSGVGKSTLLGLIGGLLEPAEGSVEIPGAGQRRFAWVLQTLNSLSARTVLSNATLLARLDGESQSTSSARALGVLDALGLGEVVAQRARHLSGGELQRMAVARAIASSRPIILADEPTNQLDQASALITMRLLVSEAEESQRCVLIVTHDRDSLPANCRVFKLTENGLVGS